MPLSSCLIAYILSLNELSLISISVFQSIDASSAVESATEALIAHDLTVTTPGSKTPHPTSTFDVNIWLTASVESVPNKTPLVISLNVVFCISTNSTPGSLKSQRTPGPAVWIEQVSNIK